MFTAAILEKRSGCYPWYRLQKICFVIFGLSGPIYNFLSGTHIKTKLTPSPTNYRCWIMREYVGTRQRRVLPQAALETIQ